ncbi:MAG: DUF5107 domain-containing protein [Chloroflexota bacterium]
MDESTLGESLSVSYEERSITLPTYPIQAYQLDAIDPLTQWPYKIFDRDRFLAEQPKPENKTYRLIVLENKYLQLLILPELGGRLWQINHKSSGNRLFYQNRVVKPSPWGPGNQLGWLALGGLEWNLPVIEHGYDWGTEWQVSAIQHSPDLASVMLETPLDGRALHAAITIWLQADMASVIVQPKIRNVSDQALDFDYWQTAMLAPGPENAPSSALQFILPSTEVMVHSTGDPALPPSGERMSWPSHQNRNLSRLGNWEDYLGLFEYPSAQGPFVGVYDGSYNAGGVRIYPAKIVRGSKIFGLGWGKALSSDYFTDDGSAYVELHGGLAPSFFEQARLARGEHIEWRESWYPVQGIGGISYANEIAAIHLSHVNSVLTVGLYAVLPIEGWLVVSTQDINNDVAVARQPVRFGPTMPLNSIITNIERADSASIAVRLEDNRGQVLLETALR